MNSHSSLIPAEQWLDLSDAAQLLGIHFTTLRRWADQGKITHIRTPGGRRRFSVYELHRFLVELQRGENHQSYIEGRLVSYTLDQARETIRHLGERSEGWMAHIRSEQRTYLRSQGQRMLNLLLQYATHEEDEHIFLEEARSIGQTYGELCRQIGMNTSQIIEAFMVFQGSILESIMVITRSSFSKVEEGQRVFHRSSKFLGDVMLSILEGYYKP
jgi:excisionase family DNA binding protein